MTDHISGLCSFLKRSSSAFHAVDAVCEELRKNSFVPLYESSAWKLEPGKKYYVTRNLSSVIAFTVPACGFAPFMAVASHSDSPVFRLKQKPCLHAAGHYTLLNTERYGGMIMNTWLDRPLSIAGRVLLETDSGMETRLVDFKRDMVLIPNVAIHMNREINEKNALNAQVDMMPLFSDNSRDVSIEDLAAAEAGAEPGQVLGSDLYLYNRMQPSVWGPGDCFVSAPRLDDLECVFTSMKAFLSAAPGGHINMLCVFDNEEVGSCTRQGADSSFFDDIIRRIADSLGASSEMVQTALASSFVVSADNAHAAHPNHPEKADAENRPFMNEGIVVKFSANQKYTTDGISKAVFTKACRRAGVPIQFYSNRSDIPGGSTLGNISCSHVSVHSIDIGLAQLAMHSSYETAGTKDVEHMINGLKAVYETEFRMTADGSYTIR